MCDEKIEYKERPCSCGNTIEENADCYTFDFTLAIWKCKTCGEVAMIEAKHV